jgi:hypothetical protein
LAAGFVGVEAVVADGLLAFGREVELVAAALTPSSVQRLPAKKSLPGQETWSQATMLESRQPEKSSLSSA